MVTENPNVFDGFDSGALACVGWPFACEMTIENSAMNSWTSKHEKEETRVSHSFFKRTDEAGAVNPPSR